jgi:hypothetical protein
MQSNSYYKIKSQNILIIAISINQMHQVRLLKIKNLILNNNNNNNYNNSNNNNNNNY